MTGLVEWDSQDLSWHRKGPNTQIIRPVDPHGRGPYGSFTRLPLRRELHRCLALPLELSRHQVLPLALPLELPLGLSLVLSLELCWELPASPRPHSVPWQTSRWLLAPLLGLGPQ